MMRRSKWQGWNAWVLPAAILCFIISLTPWIIMIWNSFFNVSYTKMTSGDFVGLTNYREVFRDPSFLVSVKNTLVIILVALPLEFLLGLIIAVFVSQHIRMRKFVVPILTIPMIIAPSVVGLIWGLNLNPSFGPVGIGLRLLGIAQDGLFAQTSTALMTIIAIDIWEYTPFMFLLFLSGLVGQPKEPLEAASVDGASSWQTFKRISIPGLKPIFIVGFLLRFTDLYKIFDTVWTTTGGGPGLATETLSVLGYRVNFSYWHIGYGSAMVMIIFIISYLASLVFFHTVVPPEKKIT
jgi:multiple sugar transport system permease protein